MTNAFAAAALIVNGVAYVTNPRALKVCYTRMSMLTIRYLCTIVSSALVGNAVAGPGCVWLNTRRALSHERSVIRRTLEDSPAFAMIQRVSPPELPMAARRMWARGLDLVRDNPQLTLDEAAQELDATEYLPLVIEEREIVARRRVELAGGPPPTESALDGMTAFIDLHEEAGYLNYPNIAQFIQLHDGVMSENGTFSPNPVDITGLFNTRGIFPLMIRYPEPNALPIRRLNRLWRSLARPLGRNRFREPYDGRLIDYFGFHDSGHAVDSVPSAMLEGYVRTLPLSELEHVLALHTQLQSAYFNWPRSLLGAIDAQTADDLVELDWARMDHESASAWQAIFIDETRPSNIYIAQDFSEAKRRLARFNWRTPISPDTFAKNILSFSEFFAGNFFDRSISNANDRAALMRLGQRMLASPNRPKPHALYRALDADPLYHHALQMLRAILTHNANFLGIPLPPL